MMVKRAIFSAVLLIAAGALSLPGWVTTRTLSGQVASASPAQAEAADRLAQVTQYVQAQEALAADDFMKAKTALKQLVPLVDATARPLVEAAANAPNIVTMRSKFWPLSELFVKGNLPSGYARAYCPMYERGAPWIQKDGPVRNPYYGSTMLTCGTVDSAPGAHMDHSPQHAGLVFMAPDDFHHLEGVFPTTGVFRLFATDNFRTPVDVSGWSGRAVLEEEYDESSDEFREVKGIPLTPAPNGNYLQATVGDGSWPREITAKVIFQTGFPEERFDFIFATMSTESVAPTAAVGERVPPPTSTLAERIRPPIPERAVDIVAEIATRDAELRDLIGRGVFPELYIPALQAKELALALNDRSSDLPEEGRDKVRIAARSLVRSAWLLDWYGDLGNGLQVEEAYKIFGSAVADILRVYEHR